MLHMSIIAIVLLTLSFAAIPAGAEWSYLHGRENELCDGILERLNRYTWNPASEELPCTWGVVSTYPEFKEPPWEDLDAKRHSDLIFKLLKYQDCGAEGYFGKGKCMIGRPDKYYRKEVQRFIEEGGKLQLWRARLVKAFVDGPAPPGPQKVIQIRMKRSIENETRRCPNKPTADWWRGGLFIVTDDLSGPHPKVIPSQSWTLNNSAAFLFSGNIYYVDSSDEVWIGIDYNGESHLVCDLNYVEPNEEKEK